MNIIERFQEWQENWMRKRRDMAGPSMKDVALKALEMGRAQSAHYTQLEDSYRELLSAVVSEHPSETRHETALRYIQERERRTSGSSKEKR